MKICLLWKAKLVNMGVQYHGNHGEEFATLWPKPYLLSNVLLLRNLRLAPNNIVDAQKVIRFR